MLLEAEEETKHRHEQEKIRVRHRRDNEDVSERERRKESVSDRRKNENSSEREHVKNRIDNENASERRTSVTLRITLRIKQRCEEEQVHSLRNSHKIAFAFDPPTPYQFHKDLDIGWMNIVCREL